MKTNMKKLLCLTLTLLLLALAMTLAACRGKDTPDETEPETSSPATEVPTSPADTAAPESTPETAPDDPPDTEPLPTSPVGKLTIGGVELSEFVILAPADMTPVERLAANELSEFLSLACGVNVPRATDDKSYPHAIRIGRASGLSDGSLGEEGYILRVRDGDLHITGGTDRGTLYGVYGFLDQYVGCRFLSADKTYIRPSASVEIPAAFDVTFVPALEYREVGYFGTMEQPVFAARLGLNGTMGRDLGDVGGGVVFAHESYSGWRTYTYTFGHTMAVLNEQNYAVGEQACYSDEATFGRVLKNVRKWFKANPQAKLISVTQTDGDAKGCQCDTCRKINTAEGTPMGTMLLFVNRIAEAIAGEFPDVRVLTYAYADTVVPPKTIFPAGNVVICLCSIDCCTNHPYTQADCKGCAQFLTYLDKWSEISPNLYVYDYMINYHYMNMTVNNLHALLPDMRLWMQHGAKGLFALGNLNCTDGEFGELRTFLEASLMMHPDMTDEEYEARMDDFLRGWYGDGWEQVKAYILRMESLTAGQHLGGTDAPGAQIPTLASDAALRAELLNYWKAALTATENDPEAHARVEKSSVQAEYLILCVAFDEEPDNAARAKALYKLMRADGITHLRENTPFKNQYSFSRSPIYWIG